MRYRILGPLEIRRDDGRLVRLAGPRSEKVVSALLLEANRVVPTERLVDILWNDNPPCGAVKQARNCVSMVRAALAERGAPAPVTRTGAGYQLAVKGQDLDVLVFRGLLDEAARQIRDGACELASRTLRQAVSLWCGPVLGGMRNEVLQPAVAHLAEQRLHAREQLADVELRLGRHVQLIGPLAELAAEYPLREQVVAQLMLALYRAGQRAEALAAYRQLYARLDTELGIAPGKAVSGLHDQMLRDDPALAGGQATAVAAARADVVPRQLPAAVPHFTGRAQEVAKLDELAGQDAIVTIEGPAGIGKTALAVHWAHRVAARFPDGQLHVNLRGFDPSGSPLAPGDALRRFLIALGRAAESIPVEAEEQQALYRSLLAGKRVLVLLDNARDAGQVRPLLPGGPGCVVVVTSRCQLTGLAITEGARQLRLDVLGSDDARSLLASRMGSGRVHFEHEAAEELATACGGLPLALAIVAARAAGQPGLSLADLAAGLKRAASRLDALSTPDPASDPRTVFSWSFRQLDEPASRLFRLLGLHPGPDVTAPAAASLARLDAAQARALLAELTRRNLLTEHLPGRFTFHDLLREYAISLASRPDDSQEAFGRLFDHYLSAAAVAMNVLYPAEAHRRPSAPPGSPPVRLDGPLAALSWLDAERACLVAITTAPTTALRWPGHAGRLSGIVERYLECGHYPEGLAIHGHARDVARQAGDHDGEAGALRALGALHWRMGSREAAADHLRQALAVHRRTGNQLGQARCLIPLGSIVAEQGNHQQALGLLRQALTLSRQARDPVGESSALNNLADTLLRLGRFRPATEHLQQALGLSREQGDRNCEAHVLQTLGEVEQSRGRPARAADHYRDALAVFGRVGHLRGQAWVTARLGAVYDQLGSFPQAEKHHRQAIVLARKAGDLTGEAVAMNGLGENDCAAGRPAEAISHHATALALARDTRSLEQQARAHAGLGRAHAALGNGALARENLQLAFEEYTRLGDPAAQKIRVHLIRISLPLGAAVLG